MGAMHSKVRNTGGESPSFLPSRAPTASPASCFATRDRGRERNNCINPCQWRERLGHLIPSLRNKLVSHETESDFPFRTTISKSKRQRLSKVFHKSFYTILTDRRSHEPPWSSTRRDLPFRPVIFEGSKCLFSSGAREIE